MLPLSALARRFATSAAVGFFLAAILLQMTWMAGANSATWDEADHIYAGYMQWKHGDFGLNPEHPPLVKFLATLPLLPMQLRTPPLVDRFYRLQEADGGREFVFANDANEILFRTRMAASVLTLLLAVVVFLATREMFGTGAGLIALALLSFDPTLLGHSALVTTDVGQACFLFWAIYAFFRYAKTPTRWRLLTTGLVAGLALASKHSAVLLLPMLLILSLFEGFSAYRSFPEHSEASARRVSARLALALVVIGAIAVTVLWSWYGFRFAARPEGLSLNPTFTALLRQVPHPAEARVLATLALLRLLPQSYLYGFAHVLIQSGAFTSFLLGTIYPHPVWFYFPVAMLIKSTLTFLLLLGLTAVVLLERKLRKPREIVYLLVPAAIYMIFAMAGGMNIGVRHVLPVYIFLSVAIAGAAWSLIERDRRWLYPVAALLLFQALSVLRTLPAYVAYANEAFGGPAQVHRYLSDSSADWGQQLKDVKLYLDQHGIHNCWFAYFGQGVADFSYYGIPCKPLITADSLYFDGPHDVPPAIDGSVLMSAGVLSGFEFGPGALNAYGQFQAIKPVAVIDYGVFVFGGHFQIPLAAALSHVQKAGILLSRKQFPAALAEAQQAQALAPESAVVNNSLGQALEATGRPEEARASYEKALHLAQTVEPTFQQPLLHALEKRLLAP